MSDVKPRLAGSFGAAAEVYSAQEYEALSDQLAETATAHSRALLGMHTARDDRASLRTSLDAAIRDGERARAALEWIIEGFTDNADLDAWFNSLSADQQRQLTTEMIARAGLIRSALQPGPALVPHPIPSGWRGQEPWFKVGERVLPLNALNRYYPVHTITEITERGFKYTHERYSLGTRIGWSEGGQTFEPSRYERAADQTTERLPK